MMTPEAFHDRISTGGMERLTVDILREILTLIPDEYMKIVDRLLQGVEERSRHAGCVLFLLRPIPSLYDEVYTIILALEDPASLHNSIMMLPWDYCTLPGINLDQTERIFEQIISQMLDELARRGSNEEAYLRLTFLTRLNLGNLYAHGHNSLVNQIIQSFADATDSSDPGMRQLVSDTYTEAVIRAAADKIEWIWILDWYSGYYHFTSELGGAVANIAGGAELLQIKARRNADQHVLDLLVPMRDHSTAMRDDHYTLARFTELLQVVIDSTRHGTLPPEGPDWPAGLDLPMRRQFIVGRIQLIVQHLREEGRHLQEFIQQYRTSFLDQPMPDQQAAFNLLETGLAKYLVLVDAARDVLIPRMQQAFAKMSSPDSQVS
jgi:hypothetical protein